MIGLEPSHKRGTCQSFPSKLTEVAKTTSPGKLTHKEEFVCKKVRKKPTNEDVYKTCLRGDLPIRDAPEILGRFSGVL